MPRCRRGGAGARGHGGDGAATPLSWGRWCSLLGCVPSARGALAEDAHIHFRLSRLFLCESALPEVTQLADDIPVKCFALTFVTKMSYIELQMKRQHNKQKTARYHQAKNE